MATDQPSDTGADRDTAQRLHALAPFQHTAVDANLLHDAADLIDALRKQVTALREENARLLAARRCFTCDQKLAECVCD